MSTTLPFPNPLKDTLRTMAQDRGWPQVLAILQRGGDEELVLQSQADAQMIINAARVEMLNAGLKYPYWDEDMPNYDAAHEDAFQDVQMGFFEKVVMYVGETFPVITTV